MSGQGNGGNGKLDGGNTEGPRCLVTGATGYVGGRLVPELLDAGFRVRCMARSPEKLRDHPWAGRVETVRGDVTDPDSRGGARRGGGGAGRGRWGGGGSWCRGRGAARAHRAVAAQRPPWPPHHGGPVRT
ncbi:NAD(P)H-binding protein, partial [Streptomyces sp. NPDC059018]|uniref:NAD(P)H-binding protein n=1 Tax=Streptomyces sp. NPDC059018 TaxID=3346701 RepID=UPI003677A98A